LESTHISLATDTALTWGIIHKQALILHHTTGHKNESWTRYPITCSQILLI